MYNILSDEVTRDEDAFRINVIEHQHSGFRLVRNLGHTFFAEVITHRNIMGAKGRHVAIQVFTFESVGDNRLVLHTNQVNKPGRA